ncbi:MBL fold metallo-hydrolase [Ferviditalea candida]|uniref:MBL fold metallo-hydrolase n=1 Tax=Ferviditalea candida TaxID=3108399 RepID=A0ABU5ZG77_9BACL|nr:MBL fold metallo-hydrolase [Paenibacillaceae bacterium T2]
MDHILQNSGILPVKIDLPFRLNHVNCFLAEGETGWTIIDTGLHNASSAEAWDAHLDGKELTRIVLTHYHPDHIGYAGTLQAKTGARVQMTQTDTKTMNLFWSNDFYEMMLGNYFSYGVDEATAHRLIDYTRNFSNTVMPLPKIDEYLHEGDRIVFGRYEYELFRAPGHADGMICLFDRDNGILLSADHILPRITPNISYWFFGEQNPLKVYMDSLERFKGLNAEYVIPSHGQPFQNANRRIDEIIGHHDKRLDQALEIVNNGKSTVFEICLSMFGSRLTDHEIRFAIGETIAHLEFLAERGECRKDKDGGKWIYKKA